MQLSVQSIPINTKVNEFEPRSWRGALDTTLFDQVCRLLATDRWFSPGTPVSLTNKTDRHDITEILLKVALNTINQPAPNQNYEIQLYIFTCYVRLILYLQIIW